MEERATEGHSEGERNTPGEETKRGVTWNGRKIAEQS